jgi:hypothetical protein
MLAVRAHPLIERERAQDWALAQARECFIRDEMTVVELETAIERIFAGVRNWCEGLGRWRPA